MTASLRLAHCSDIHLDGDASEMGKGSVEYYKSGFARALMEMQLHEPDMLLIAGDLFDANTASDDTIIWAMDILGEHPLPIAMIPGNHDCLEHGSIYHRFDFNKIPNLQMIDAEDGAIARIDGLDVAVWGKGMVEHSPDFLPLDMCPERPTDCKWYLGMGHGIFVPHGGETDRSSPIPMKHIEDSCCDYLALGHHHAAMELVNDKATAPIQLVEAPPMLSSTWPMARHLLLTCTRSVRQTLLNKRLVDRIVGLRPFGDMTQPIKIHVGTAVDLD